MDNNNKYSEQNDQISRFNDAFLSVQRLHESWIMCRQYIRHGKLTNWRIELDTVWLELTPDIQRSSTKEEIIKENIKLMTTIAKAKLRTNLYFSLLARHEFLRAVQDKAGKGGSYMDDDGELYI